MGGASGISSLSLEESPELSEPLEASELLEERTPTSGASRKVIKELLE